VGKFSCQESWGQKGKKKNSLIKETDETFSGVFASARAGKHWLLLMATFKNKGTTLKIQRKSRKGKGTKMGGIDVQ